MGSNDCHLASRLTCSPRSLSVAPSFRDLPRIYSSNIVNFHILDIRTHSFVVTSHYIYPHRGKERRPPISSPISPYILIFDTQLRSNSISYTMSALGEKKGGLSSFLSFGKVSCRSENDPTRSVPPLHPLPATPNEHIAPKYYFFYDIFFYLCPLIFVKAHYSPRTVQKENKKVAKVNLGDDNAFYFNKSLNRWVERGKEDEARAEAKVCSPSISHHRPPTSERGPRAAEASPDPPPSLSPHPWPSLCHAPFFPPLRSPVAATPSSNHPCSRRTEPRHSRQHEHEWLRLPPPPSAHWLHVGSFDRPIRLHPPLRRA